MSRRATQSRSDAAAANPAADDAPLVLPDTPLDGTARILHALNRLGHGPRPGDVDRVRAQGLDRWLAAQLRPERLDDSAVEARLAAYPSLARTPVELLVAYPPSQIVRAAARIAADELGWSRAEILDRVPRADVVLPLDRAGDPAERAGMRSGSRTRSPNRIPAELAQAKLLRAIESERQLHEVLVDFWFDHFNVYAAKGAVSSWVGTYERDAIRPHVLGRFRDLLGATARHPAMLFYLDNWMSTGEGSPRHAAALAGALAGEARRLGLPPGGVPMLLLRETGADTAEAERRLAGRAARRARRLAHIADSDAPQRGLNENYARELLELHTLGVDGGYTQRDIVEVARCFTGWTLFPWAAGQQFVYAEALHDAGRKTVLGKKIRARGRGEGEEVLDRLAAHPSTARFVSTKLARRFVADDPPPALVERMARTFRATDGDLRAVVRTLLESPELWDPATVGAKVKTPFEYVASMARAAGTEVRVASTDEDGGGDGEAGSMDGATAGMDDDAQPPAAGRWIAALGQRPYFAQPPTGWPDRADAWVSPGMLLDRMKVALQLAADRAPGLRTPAPAEGVAAWSGASAGATQEDAARQATARAVGAARLGAPPAAAQVAAVAASLEGPAERAARTALALWLASPGFQRR